KGLREQVRKSFPLIQTATELCGLSLQLGIRQTAVLLFEVVDAHDRFTHLFDFSGVLTAENPGCKLCEHRPLLLWLNEGRTHSNPFSRQYKRQASQPDITSG